MEVGALETSQNPILKTAKFRRPRRKFSPRKKGGILNKLFNTFLYKKRTFITDSCVKDPLR